jgi:hypothetical protein
MSLPRPVSRAASSRSRPSSRRSVQVGHGSKGLFFASSFSARSWLIMGSPARVSKATEISSPPHGPFHLECTPWTMAWLAQLHKHACRALTCALVITFLRERFLSQGVMQRWGARYRR